MTSFLITYKLIYKAGILEVSCSIEYGYAVLLSIGLYWGLLLYLFLTLLLEILLTLLRLLLILLLSISINYFIYINSLIWLLYCIERLNLYLLMFCVISGSISQWTWVIYVFMLFIPICCCRHICFLIIFIFKLILSDFWWAPYIFLFCFVLL